MRQENQRSHRGSRMIPAYNTERLKMLFLLQRFFFIPRPSVLRSPTPTLPFPRGFRAREEGNKLWV